ncbi:hypothetical protein Tco_1178678, partial [Tanacetum coccineum]
SEELLQSTNALVVPVEDVPVQEKHKVLDYERTQQLPPTDIVKTNNDQYHDGSNDRSQDSHHFNMSLRTLELKCVPQSPIPRLDMLVHDQYQLDMDESEVHDAFDTEIPLENNKDNLSRQDGSVEAEEREEPVIENNDIE